MNLSGRATFHILAAIFLSTWNDPLQINIRVLLVLLDSTKMSSSEVLLLVFDNALHFRSSWVSNSYE